MTNHPAITEALKWIVSSYFYTVVNKSPITSSGLGTIYSHIKIYINIMYTIFWLMCLSRLDLISAIVVVPGNLSESVRDSSSYVYFSLAKA